jgi:hypothetical protein
MYFQDMVILSLNKKYEMPSLFISLISNIIHKGILKVFLEQYDVIIPHQEL